MRRTGQSEHVIMRAAGWRTPSMFTRYDIVSEDDLAALFDATTDFVSVAETQPRKLAALSPTVTTISRTSRHQRIRRVANCGKSQTTAPAESAQ